jgi:phage shock protein PspC (stress-responsive transcriptional regulator)
MRYENEYSVNKTLAKDTIHKKLSGVCGGIAKYYDVPRIAIRIASVLALITFPVATGVAYLVATLVMPNRKY